MNDKTENIILDILKKIQNDQTVIKKQNDDLKIDMNLQLELSNRLTYVEKQLDINQS